MLRLAIYGAGGHGKVVADTSLCAGWQQIDFFDENLERQIFSNYHISGNLNDLRSVLLQYDGIVVAVGDNRNRYKISTLIKEEGGKLATIIHPHAFVSRFATIEEGTVLLAGVVVNASARVGFANIINTSATIDHDCHLGNAVHISPGANLAGGVNVGDFSWIGIGACVKEKVHIGIDSVVGAGAAVVNDIPNECVFVGVPAHKKERLC